MRRASPPRGPRLGRVCPGSPAKGFLSRSPLSKAFSHHKSKGYKGTWTSRRPALSEQNLPSRSRWCISKSSSDSAADRRLLFVWCRRWPMRCRRRGPDQPGGGAGCLSATETSLDNGSHKAWLAPNQRLCCWAARADTGFPKTGPHGPRVLAVDNGVYYGTEEPGPWAPRP